MATKTKWTQEQIDLLGTATDPIVAEMTGHAKHVIRRKRVELGIPSYQSQHPFDRKLYRRKDLLARTYGITLADYDAMLEAQGHCCAICGMTPGDNGRRLTVDHDHETGKVRGLLCNACNVGVGMFQDNPILLRGAINYLRRN